MRVGVVADPVPLTCSTHGMDAHRRDRHLLAGDEERRLDAVLCEEIQDHWGGRRRPVVERECQIEHVRSAWQIRVLCGQPRGACPPYWRSETRPRSPARKAGKEKEMLSPAGGATCARSEAQPREYCRV